MRTKRNLLAAALGASAVWFGDRRQGERRRRRARATVERYVRMVKRTGIAGHDSASADRPGDTTPSSGRAAAGGDAAIAAQHGGDGAVDRSIAVGASTLAEVLAAAESTGVRADFAAENGRVVCGVCHTASEPSTLEREWVHRLEGASDPDEMLAVSALVCPECGALGVLVLPYGPAADEIEAEMSRQLRAPRQAGMAPLAAPA